MERILRALIVEDLEDDALLLVQHLSRADYTLQWQRVDSPDRFVAALENQEWDIIFADYSMPRFSGTRALTLVRDRGIDTPFIFVSGTIGEDVAVSAMKAGAQNYIMKDNLKRLVPAVERELRDAQLRSERRRAQMELRLLETATQAAANAGDIVAALAVTMDKVCEHTGWVVGQAWLPREDGSVLECCPAWSCHHGGMESFRAASLGVVFTPGEDLLGRVWQSKQPRWTLDVTTEPDFLRASAARAAGLKTGMTIPVLAGNDVIAILEFFVRESQEQEGRSMQLFLAVASQLGSVIQRKRAEERLHHMAHYDSLTGLPNRVLFTDRLKQAMVDANRHERLVGVAFLDLDRFKTINDSLGHGVGDMLLQGVADRLGHCVRQGDTVARLAGDEFTLVLADMAHVDHAAHVAQKVLDSLSQPFHIAGQELFTSASLGMTLFPFDDESVEGLLRNADIAMYRAKDQGGHNYQFYSADMTSKARERLSLENDMRRAFERNEFVMHYQPIVGLRSGKIVAVEALARWNHPQRGLMSPGEFIPLAEETGLIVPLGEWVLHSVIGQCTRLTSAGVSGLRVAVNLSACQFQQQDIVGVLQRMLALAGVSAEQLQLEITESVLMYNVEATAKALGVLSDMGVELSLDDFGTGYSSLSYLKRFPIDVLKIDRSFVRDIPGDPDDAAIASAIVSMAHSLGIRVVAEGVETPEQLQFLRQRDCDNGQGHYFSRPKPVEEISGYLRTGTPLPWS